MCLIVTNKYKLIGHEKVSEGVCSSICLEKDDCGHYRHLE